MVPTAERKQELTGRPGRVGRELGPPSIVREVAKFVAASLVAVIVFVAAGLPLLRHLGRNEAIRQARAVASLAAVGVVEPSLDDAVLAGDPKALARLDRVVQQRVLSDSIVRVKIWSPDGRVVYSDEPRLIGARYRLGEERAEGARVRGRSCRAEQSRPSREPVRASGGQAAGGLFAHPHAERKARAVRALPTLRLGRGEWTPHLAVVRAGVARGALAAVARPGSACVPAREARSPRP